MSDRLLDIKEASQVLGVPVGTLYAWRKRKRHETGDAPKSFKVGRSIKYRQSVLEEWLKTREAA